MAGRFTIGNAYVRLVVDAAGTRAEAVAKAKQASEGVQVKAKLSVDDKGVAAPARRAGERAAKEFGSTLNARLKRIDVEEIDFRTNPLQTLEAIARVERRLHDVQREGTIAMRVESAMALAELERIKKRSNITAKIDVDRGWLARVGAAAGVDFQQAFITQGLGGLSRAMMTVLRPAIMSALSSPPVAAGVAIAGAALGSFIVASINGAILAGLGVGVIAAGIAIAMQDPRIEAGAAAMGDRVMVSLQRAVQPLKPAIIGAFLDIEAGFDRLEPRLAEIFGTASEYVRPLTQALLGFAQNILPGIRDALVSMRPLIDMLTTAVPQLGRDLGESFRILGTGSEGAAKGLRDLLWITGELARGTATLIASYSGLYEVMGLLLPRMFSLADVMTVVASSPLGNLVNAIRGTGNETRKTDASLAGMESRLRSLDPATQTFNAKVATLIPNIRSWSAAAGVLTDKTNSSGVALGAVTQALGTHGAAISATIAKHQVLKGTTGELKSLWDATRGSVINVTEAEEALHAATDGLTQSIGANGHSLDIHTGQGRTNRDALQGLYNANRDLFYANIESGMSLDQATGKFKTNKAQIDQNAVAAGLNKTEVDKLGASYGALPDNVTTDVSTRNIEKVYAELLQLQFVQEGLKKGWDLATIKSTWKNVAGVPAPRAWATGGPVWGTGTSTSDSIPARLSHGEFVVKAASAKLIGYDALASLNKLADAPSNKMAMFSDGGPVRAFKYGGPVIGEPRFYNPGTMTVPFPVETKYTKIPFTIDQLKEKYAPSAGAAVPGGGSGHAGNWAGMFNWARSRFPYVSLNSGYRPGDPGYHGSGRAVDLGVPDPFGTGRWWHVFNAIKSTFFGSIRELIWDFAGSGAVWNGRNHFFTGSGAGPGTHADHIHWAMKNGGIAGVDGTPTVGYDDGGWLPPGLSLVENNTGKPEPVLNPPQWAAVKKSVATSSTPPTINIHQEFHGTNLTEAEVKRATHEAFLEGMDELVAAGDQGIRGSS